MRHHRRPWTSWARLCVPLTLALGAPAAAGEPVEETPAPTTKRAAQILDHMDWTPEEKSDLFARFGIDTRQGVSYRRTVQIGGHSFEWGVYGPVQRRQSFGLGFKIRF